MKLKTPYWLMSYDDSWDIMEKLGWDMDFFWENGIINPYDAELQIIMSRWGDTDTIECPICNNVDEHYHLDKIKYKAKFKCKKCLKRFSATSMTFLSNCKLEYYKIWRFAYIIGEFNINNSSFIARDLEITQKSAWGLIETLRTSRKIDKKFKNGEEVLQFKHMYEVLGSLLKIDKNSKEINDEANLKKEMFLNYKNKTENNPYEIINSINDENR